MNVCPSVLLIVGSLAIAAPAWSADATNHPAQNPTTTAPAPTNNSPMMGGMSGMGQNNGAPNSNASMMANCRQPMDGMQKGLGGMMGNIDDMMKLTNAPDMRKRLQDMRDQMSAMMVRMRQMQGMTGGTMMHGGMMRGGQEPATASPATAPPAADHDAHHPN
jgi:hypothetical protein